MIGNAITGPVCPATNLGGGKRKAESGNSETAKRTAQRGLDSGVSQSKVQGFEPYDIGVSKSNGQDLDDLFLRFWDPEEVIRAELDSFTINVEIVAKYSEGSFDGSGTTVSDELDTASDGFGTTVSDELDTASDGSDSDFDGENVDPLLRSKLVDTDLATCFGRQPKPSIKLRSDQTYSAKKAQQLTYAHKKGGLNKRNLNTIFGDSIESTC